MSRKVICTRLQIMLSNIIVITCNEFLTSQLYKVEIVLKKKALSENNYWFLLIIDLS